MTDFEVRMAAIRARFVDRAREDIAIIERADPDLGSASADNEALATTAHKLAGIAGTLGHKDISALAAALEAALVEGADSATVGCAREELLRLLREICR